MLELRRLALLHAFAARGSIAAVAAAAGYSASAVSQQLAVLERETGTALLERSARSAALTEAGQRLAAHAAAILDAMEAAEADLASGDPAGRVVVSTVPTVAVAIAPALVRLDGPSVVLRQHGPDEALDHLRAREVDVAVVDSWQPPPPQPDLLRTELLRDPLVVAGPAGGETWLCAPPDQPSRRVADEVMAELGVTPAILWEFEGLVTLAELVATGVGTAVLPRLALLRVDVETAPLGRHRRIDAVIRTGSRRRPAVAAVVDALRACFA